MRVHTLVFAALLAVPAVASGQVRLPQGDEAVNRASELIVRGDYAKAEPILLDAIKRAPANPYAHFNLGSVYRATGRNDEAIQQFRQALDIFETTGPRANGEGDLAASLYNIALATEAKGDPRASVSAWDAYIRFARKYAREQPSVEIAKNRVDAEMRLAQMKGPFPFGPQKATRPSTTR
jgi:tetratricopeptide (TPR) repeat protein